MTTDAQPPAGEPTRELAPRPKAIEEANESIKAPWAAGVAGLLFAALFTSAVFLVRSSPTVGATTEELRVIYATGQDQPALIAGLYLMPFAGIMFLWFIAVIRDQIGEREDRFFATVFLGSGLIFVSTLFVASAVATSPSVGVRYLDQ